MILKKIIMMFFVMNIIGIRLVIRFSIMNIMLIVGKS